MLKYIDSCCIIIAYGKLLGKTRELKLIQLFNIIIILHDFECLYNPGVLKIQLHSRPLYTYIANLTGS